MVNPVYLPFLRAYLELDILPFVRAFVIRYALQSAYDNDVGAILFQILKWILHNPQLCPLKRVVLCFIFCSGAHVKQNVFWERKVYLVTLFLVPFCIQIGQKFESHWFSKDFRKIDILTFLKQNPSNRLIFSNLQRLKPLTVTNNCVYNASFDTL